MVGIQGLPPPVKDHRHCERAIIQRPARCPGLDTLLGGLQGYRAQSWRNQMEKDMKAGFMFGFISV